MSWGYDLLIDAQRNGFWTWATRYALAKSTVMVGDCNTIRRKAVTYGMPDERIVTFPWGIDLDKFSPAPDHPGRQPFTLLSTRSWEPIYGVDVLAQAFVLAIARLPALRLVMLGNGSLSNRLQAIFHEAGVLDKVVFPGIIGQTDLPSYYHQADLYVCASHSDGTSISLLEALACACPVIVSDIPGDREWVTPGVQGWLFPDGDAPALAQAILHAFDNRNQLAGIGQSARCLAEQRADWNINVSGLFKAHQIAFQYVDKNNENRQVIQ
jgi:glycosyltransferase involved in cell wall biosynthesis